MFNRRRRAIRVPGADLRRLKADLNHCTLKTYTSLGNFQNFSYLVKDLRNIFLIIFSFVMWDKTIGIRWLQSVTSTIDACVPHDDQNDHRPFRKLTAVVLIFFITEVR